MNASKDTLEAENPKPLNPLTIDAKRIIPQKNKNSKKDKFIISRNSIQILISVDYTLHKTN